MDAMSPSSPVEQVAFMKGAQVGGTECGNNWLGYVVHHTPGPMMYVLPTLDMAKRTSRQRIAPMIEAMPVLRDLVKDPRSRDSGNTQMVKEFLNGVLMNLALICMDSGGHFTDEVYAFSRKQGVDWVIPIKGASQSGKPIATFPTPALSPSLHLMGRKWIRSPVAPLFNAEESGRPATRIADL